MSVLGGRRTLVSDLVHPALLGKVWLVRFKLSIKIPLPDALRQTHSNEANALIEELQFTIAEIYRAIDKFSDRISRNASRESTYAAGRKQTIPGR